MSIAPLLVLAGLGLVIGLLPSSPFRRALLLVASATAVFALQPATPLRAASFWFPALSLCLTAVVSLVVRPPGGPWKDLLLTGVALASVAVVIGLLRAFPIAGSLMLAPAPWLGLVAAMLVVAGVGAILARTAAARAISLAVIVGVLSLFVVLKSEAMATGASSFLRRWTGQSPDLAAPIDLTWLGFSYLAFRLLHVLLDWRAGRLPAVASSELVTYALFFPALTAGPIDRIERFVGDLRQPAPTDADAFREGGWRILLGMVKKFVIADTLGLIALTPLSAERVASAAWLWVLLYAFSLQLYFDFSGYTDVALGTARLMGIRLPENFRRPYLQPNLTAFWNNWHITLTDWFRTYVFNPITRRMRSLPRPWPAAAVIFLGQMTTMILIGLWHGISWTFVLWGAWHGLGLFVQNRWSAMTRSAAGRLAARPVARHLLSAAGTLLTFHFVTLGWVWFTLPDAATAGRLLQRLFGG